MKKCTME